MENTKPYHLFVVEDDPAMRDMLSAYLEKQGMAVTSMPSAEDLMRRIHRLRPDLVVLDVSLPGESGLSACQRLRADGDRVPIILLTARTEEIDRVLGLEMGADDYLGKPFSARELLARIRAVLRRPREDEAPAGAALMFDGWRLDLVRRELSQPGGEIVTLSAGEFSLLRAFAERPGRVLTRDQLLEAARGADADVFDRAMDVQISRLRKKLDDGSGRELIATIRGEGYRFDARVRRADRAGARA